MLSLIATVCGFGLIWHIWWMAVGSFVLLIGSTIFHTFNLDRDYYIPAEEVAETEALRSQQLATART